ncbi:hypothetical protein DB771_20240 [Burkholderia sp. AU29985]|nr:hypothetical protein XM57_24535 [Burkholderia cepacia]AYZ93897.1 hypothetical protein EGY28_01595 [Burkholderia dolosa]ETP63712.1 hypothetical protein BDSB_18535 [Burkholderia dolosa PC543]PRE55123.1 hypothetical protein C6P87_05100 [Burkholderia sp. AU12872]PUA75120.1 hypothetical protein DB771_20240 [Burkholderia sp. AU29985]
MSARRPHRIGDADVCALPAAASSTTETGTRGEQREWQRTAGATRIVRAMCVSRSRDARAG